MGKLRDNKVVVGVVLVLVIGIIIGSVYMSRQRDASARREAMEETLGNIKETVEEGSDPFLAELVEIQHVKEVSREEDEMEYEVILSFPELKEGYDRFYNRLLEEEVWKEDSMENAITGVYEETMKEAPRENFVLPENIRIKRTDEGDWEKVSSLKVPLHLPENPVSAIHEDFGLLQKLEAGAFSLEAEPEGTIAELVVEQLETREDFPGYEVKLDQEPKYESRDEDTYSVKLVMSDVKSFNDLGNIKELWDYREDITDKESLGNMLVERMDDLPEKVSKVHQMRVWPIDTSDDTESGYRVSKEHVVHEGWLEDLVSEEKIAMGRLNFDRLTNLYTTNYVGKQSLWTEPIWTINLDSKTVLDEKFTDGEIAYLYSVDGELHFSTYDQSTGEKTGNVLVKEDFTKHELGDTYDSFHVYAYNIRAYNDFYVLDYISSKQKKQIVERVGEELVLHQEVPMNSITATIESDVILHDGTVYSIKNHVGTQEESGLQIKNHTDDEVVKSMEYREDGPEYGFYFSENSKEILVYTKNVNSHDESLGYESELLLYDLEEGKAKKIVEVHESMNDDWIQEVKRLDDERLLILGDSGSLWTLDLENLHVEKVGADMITPTEEEMRLMEMRDGYYFLINTGQGYAEMVITESYILKDEDGVLRSLVELPPMMYCDGNDVFITTESPEDESIYFRKGIKEISYSALGDIDEPVAFDDVQAMKEAGVLRKFAAYNVEDKSSRKLGILRVDQDLLLDTRTYYLDRSSKDLFVAMTEGRQDQLLSAKLIPGQDNREPQTRLMGHESIQFLYDLEKIYYRDGNRVYLFGLHEILEQYREKE